MSAISVILPTYNEKENIEDLIRGLIDSLPDLTEIIVVDDDSPDETWKIAGDMGIDRVKVIRREGERGLATAIARGVREAEGDVVGWMDADLCHPPDIMGRMAGYLADHDAVIGSRYVSGGNDNRGFFRVLTSRIINWFSGLILGFGVKDYDSGFILIKKKVFNKVPFPDGGYGDYFIELMYKARKAGFRIKEVPYIFTDRAKGTSKTAGSIFEFFRLGLGYIKRIIFLRFGK